VSLDEDNFCDCRCLLTVFVSLDVLPELGHDGAELQVELAEVAIGLQLGAELVVRLLVLVHRLVVSFGGRGAHTVVFVKVHARISCAFFPRGNDATSLL